MKSSVRTLLSLVPYVEITAVCEEGGVAMMRPISSWRSDISAVVQQCPTSEIRYIMPETSRPVFDVRADPSKIAETTLLIPGEYLGADSGRSFYEASAQLETTFGIVHRRPKHYTPEGPIDL
jgi:hypothetical protein